MILREEFVLLEPPCATLMLPLLVVHILIIFYCVIHTSHNTYIVGRYKLYNIYIYIYIYIYVRHLFILFILFIFLFIYINIEYFWTTKQFAKCENSKGDDAKDCASTVQNDASQVCEKILDHV